MEKSPPEFIFLKDEPQTKSEVSYKRFYHNSIAPALKKILKDDTSPHTIGLFGAWGAGKSTVIEMVKNDRALDMPVFIFDAWKYKDDTLRRTFLIKLVDFLKDNKIKIDENILTPLYNSTTNSVTKNGESPDEQMKPWHKKLWNNIRRFALQITLITSVVFIILFNTVWQHLSIAELFRAVLSFVASVSVLVVVLKPAIEEIVKVAVNSLFSKQVSQTELITKTIQQDRLNSPEQFEAKFIEILEHVNKKMVIVFDNIDRVQGDVAISMLSTIKTFMYSNAKNGLVFIVPCDPTAIEVQVEKYFYGTNGTGSDSFGAAEYLRKIFNLIIWIPDFINTDLEQYTKDLIGKTGAISKLLNDEDVILVINSAFSQNPREIIQFINNLVAMVISTRGTGVKDIIDGDIAYLAKVLILRQKFPKAYESLKENWNHPEAISNGTKVIPEFTSFMQRTSRITVDDAEPFIYFKDPADSRGLKDATSIKNALIAGNVTEAIEASKSEPAEKLIEFITDLVAKYSGQENQLNSVVTTQFEVIPALGIEANSKRYINEIAKTIDTELWPKHEELPLPHIFKLLTNKKISPVLRVNLLTRYLGVIDSETPVTALKLGIIASLKENSSVLNKQQRTEFRTILESNYATSEEALGVFDDTESQEAFITEKLMKSYIESFDFDNLPTKLATIESFKEYVLKHSLIPDVVSGISELLKKDIVTTSSFNENKGKIIEAVSLLTGVFGQELKNGSGYLSEIAQNIIKVVPYTSQWEQRADQVIALFWIRNYVNDTDRPAVLNAIQSYFQSYSELPQFQKPLDYWNKESTGRFIKLILPTILPRLSTSREILQYIYDRADSDEKKTVINDLITRIPPDNYYDIDFISSLDKLPGRKNILSALLDKANRNTYPFKERYFEFIASKLLKSDSAELKSALDQITMLIESNNTSQADIGYVFLNRLEHLQSTDKRKLAANLLTWLLEPGRTLTAVQHVAFQVINSYYPLLQDTSKNDYIHLLFNLLTETQDLQMLRVVVGALNITQPTYKTHAKDFDDLLSRMQTWSNTQTKQETFDVIREFSSARRSKAEKTYWDAFSKLYPPPES